MSRRKTTPFDPATTSETPQGHHPPPAPTKRVPTTTILDRRLVHPFGAPSVPITMKDGGCWELRIVDAQLRSGHLHNIRAGKGWEFVTPADIDGTPDEYGFRVLDGRLVRGENGREVLMKMPKEMYDRIAMAKAEQNLKGLGKKATRELAAQTVAKEFGAHAGETVYKSVRIGNEDIPVMGTTTTRGPSAELEGEEFV